MNWKSITARASSSAALVIALGAALCAGTAAAEMPPPTPDEQAAAEQRRAHEQVQLEREKAALERVQDQVVARYHREPCLTRSGPRACRSF